jgi:hypothetical protein
MRDKYCPTVSSSVSFVARRGNLTIMGWIQDSTPAEDNAACVFTWNVERMTWILMNIQTSGSWIKDKTCRRTRLAWIILEKIMYDTDIGKKRAPQSLPKAQLLHSSADTYEIIKKILQKSSIFCENFEYNLIFFFLDCRTVRTYSYLWVFQKYRNDSQFKNILTWQRLSKTGIAKHSLAILHVYAFMSTSHVLHSISVTTKSVTYVRTSDASLHRLSPKFFQKSCCSMYKTTVRYGTSQIFRFGTVAPMTVAVTRSLHVVRCTCALNTLNLKRFVLGILHTWSVFHRM